jgi:hypothetical protein
VESENIACRFIAIRSLKAITGIEKGRINIFTTVDIAGEKKRQSMVGKSGGNGILVAEPRIREDQSRAIVFPLAYSCQGILIVGLPCLFLLGTPSNAVIDIPDPCEQKRIRPANRMLSGHGAIRPESRAQAWSLAEHMLNVCNSSGAAESPNGRRAA